MLEQELAALMRSVESMGEVVREVALVRYQAFLDRADGIATGAS